MMFLIFIYFFFFFFWGGGGGVTVDVGSKPTYEANMRVPPWDAHMPDINTLVIEELLSFFLAGL